MLNSFDFDTDDKGLFEFKHTDVDGGTNVLKFSADTWTEALEKFIQFLRGSGFFLDYDSIGINGNKHTAYSSELLTAFYPDDESDQEIEIPGDMGFPGIDASMIPCSTCNRCFGTYGGNE